MKKDIKDEKMTSEETIIDNETKAENVAPKKFENVRKVIIGGVAGLFLGTAGTAAANSLNASEPEDSADAESSGRYDDMSFSEAFSSARTELGPGGEFEWHGGLYSTYNETEWNQLHPSQTDENVSGNVSENLDVEVVAEEPTAVEGDTAAAPQEPASADDEVEVVADETVSGDDEVEILGADSETGDTAESEVEVEVLSGSDISGEEASFVNLETEDVSEEPEGPEITDAVEDVFVGDASDDDIIM